jgi:NTE family protein
MYLNDMVNNDPRTSAAHRAIVFQGGGSLGSYEAGAYKAIYELLSREDLKEGRTEKEQPFIHIVAGTSIGAINASILVSYVKENRTWKGSAERLIDFWRYVSTESFVDTLPAFEKTWDYWHSVDNNVATSEAARRYYSTREFMFRGVSTVFRPKKSVPDGRFLDPLNTWFQYNSEPLKESLEKFAHFPIATSFENNEPRLLLTSVDVQEGIPVVFDSYPKGDGKRRTVYGRGIRGTIFEKEQEKKEKEFQKAQERSSYVILYDDGITSDFVMASCSVPVNYDYTRLEVIENTSDGNSNRDSSDDSLQLDKKNRKQVRYFWDGGLLANTPLRQVILAHDDFWYAIREANDNPPPLEICIVNLHPSKQEYLAQDLDGVIDRKYDILYHDRTEFDERMAVLISDYTALVSSLIKLAQKNGTSNDSIDTILQKKAHFKSMLDGHELTYGDLAIRRPEVQLVIRIERSNDVDTVANKTFDFSSKTIDHLISDGYGDATEQLKNGKFNVLEWNEYI